MKMEVPPNEQKSSAPLVLLGGVLLLALGSSVIPASWFGIQPETRKRAPLALSSIADPDVIATDADNDGRISWKEYIASSLNAPEAASSSTHIETDPRAIAALNDPNNLTSSFTKNLYMASVALGQSGVADEATEQSIITELVQDEAKKIAPTAFTEKDVRVYSSSSKDDLRAYGNAIAPLLRDILTEESIAADLMAIGTFTTTRNEADLIPIIKSKQRIDGVLQKLLGVRVPQPALDTHIRVLNSLGRFQSVLRDLSRAYDDPVRATFAVQAYPDAAISTLRSIPYVGLFFSSQGITFSGKEAGYLFVKGYTQ